MKNEHVFVIDATFGLENLKLNAFELMNLKIQTLNMNKNKRNLQATRMVRRETQSKTFEMQRVPSIPHPSSDLLEQIDYRSSTPLQQQCFSKIRFSTNFKRGEKKCFSAEKIGM